MASFIMYAKAFASIELWSVLVLTYAHTSISPIQSNEKIETIVNTK